MNKKDVGVLGYLLAIVEEDGVPGVENFWKAKIFALDPRIEAEYDGYAFVVGRDEEIMEKFEELMIKELGHDWSLSGVCTGVLTKKIWRKAESLVEEL